MSVPSKHPRTEVSFAPTKVFVEKYGAAEGERQRTAYERPTWAKEPIHKVETCEIAHPKVPPEQQQKVEQPEVVLFAVAFAVGVATGAFVTWLFYQ